MATGVGIGASSLGMGVSEGRVVTGVGTGGPAAGPGGLSRRFRAAVGRVLPLGQVVDL